MDPAKRLQELRQRREQLRHDGDEYMRSENPDPAKVGEQLDAIERIDAEIAQCERAVRAYAPPPGTPGPAPAHGGEQVRGFADLLQLPRERRLEILEQVERHRAARRQGRELHRALDVAVTGDTTYPEVVLGELIDLIDSRRPLWNAGSNLPIPRQGSTIEIPKVDARPTTGNQSAFSAELSSTAFEHSNVTITKFTEGGAVVVPNQMVDWTTSPNYLDETIRQLALAYGRRTEARALAALLAVAETNENEMGSSDFAGFWAALVLSVKEVWAATGDMPDLLVVGPNGWEDLAGFLDDDNRPIFGATLTRTQTGQLVGTDTDGFTFGLRLVASAQGDSAAETDFIGVASSRHLRRGEDVLGSAQVYKPGTHETEVNFVGYGGLRVEPGSAASIIDEA